MEEEEFVVTFNDHTMIDSDGEFGLVKEMMSKEAQIAYTPMDKWTVRSQVGIDCSFGYSEMTCTFHPDGSVIIVDYSPSGKGVYYNVDLRCLSQYVQDKGWKVASPAPFLVNDMKEFWRHQWETYLVDSEYMEEKFGSRRGLEYVDDTEEEEEI